jgi:hypothetical protein
LRVLEAILRRATCIFLVELRLFSVLEATEPQSRCKSWGGPAAPCPPKPCFELTLNPHTQTRRMRHPASFKTLDRVGVVAQAQPGMAALQRRRGHDPSIGSGQVVSCPNKERKDGEINSPLQMEGQRGRSGAAPLQGIGEKGARLSPSTRLLAKRRLIQNRWRK